MRQTRQPCTAIRGQGLLSEARSAAQEIAETSPSSGCRHLLPARGAKGNRRNLSIPSSPQRGSEGRVETRGSTPVSARRADEGAGEAGLSLQRSCGLRPRSRRPGGIVKMRGRAVWPPHPTLRAPLPGLSHPSQPVLRTPAGEKRICRAVFLNLDVAFGTSPRPASGERVRVRGSYPRKGARPSLHHQPPRIPHHQPRQSPADLHVEVEPPIPLLLISIPARRQKHRQRNP